MGCATRERNVVFASTLASFFTRAYDQLRMAAISESNINLCGSHCGLSIGEHSPPSWPITSSPHAPTPPNLPVVTHLSRDLSYVFTSLDCYLTQLPLPALLLTLVAPSRSFLQFPEANSTSVHLFQLVYII